MDHDQRFKTLIREFFDDFLRLFFADWAARLDMSNREWLDPQLFPDPPEGARHAMDLVVRVRLRKPLPEANALTEGPALLLVHIEIEAPDRTTALKPRLPYYYHFLRDKCQLPVLPIVLYLKVGLDGVGVDSQIERLGDFEVNRFNYLYVGLPGLDGIEYVQGDNWLGVALSALMKIPPERVAWLGAEALRRLAGASLTEQQRFLLSECVQAYLSLDEKQKRQLEQLLRTESYAEVRAMNKTVFEEGIEKGIEKGIPRGMAKVICLQLERRFGRLSTENRERLMTMSSDDLTQLALKVGEGASLAELGLAEH